MCNVYGSNQEKGLSRALLSRESGFQLKVLMAIFGLLTVMLWGYDIYYFDRTNINDRDRYIFLWMFLCAIVALITYFSYRYSNLYQELKRADIIITPEQLSEMPTVTYLRYYVICGNSVYLNCHSTEINESGTIHDIIATPYLAKEKATNIPSHKVLKIIQDITGIENGDLRFFFGRELPGISKVKIFRYFYFLNGNTSDYADIKGEGEWVDFDKLKYIYATEPWHFSKITIRDITRLVTIFITQKTFNERGYRRSRIKHYHPTFDLTEVRNSNINLNDDKWIRIAEFNSDIPFYNLKRIWRKIIGTDSNSFT